MMTNALDDTVADIAAQVSALEDAKTRAINERHGDDHGVNLTRLRALAKPLGKSQEVAEALWATESTPLRLVALLVCVPRSFTAQALDVWLRDARVPKVRDWLVGPVVAKTLHAEALRLQWLADPDPQVESAGWSLTSIRIRKDATGIDLAGLLDEIEQRMADAPERLQWTMNEALAQIGIVHPEHRERAIAIGERLGVLRDYPTPPNCTSPFAPSWIAEMVRRQER